MISRRAFLEATAGSITLTAVNRKFSFAQSPNDQVVLGVIGVGGMGTGRLKQFLKLRDVRISAICDVDRSHLESAVGEVDKAGRPKPKAFGDYRRLLDDKEIDAVAIVTP